MDQGFSMADAMVSVVQNLLRAFADFIPRLVTAIIVIALGLVVAKLVERTLRALFERLRFDDALERMGVIATLQRVGLRDAPGRMLAKTVYVLLVILFVQAVTRAVALHTIADAIAAFFSYLPNLVAGFLVLLFGMMAAQFIGRAVTEAGDNSGMDYARLLGRVVSAFVMVVVVIMAVSQLQIDTAIVKQVVLVLLGGFMVALALTFGLGTRDVTRNLVAGFYARKVFRVGDPIVIRGERGELVAVTSIQTLIRRGGETVAIPNRVFLDEVVRQEDVAGA